MEPVSLNNLSLSQLQTMDVIENVDLSGRDLKGIDFSGKTLRKVSFDRADLTGANFKDTIVESVSLYETKCKKTDFSDSKISKIKGTDTDFEEAKFINSELYDFELEHPKFLKTNFTKANFKDVVLTLVSPYTTDEALALNTDFTDDSILLEACFDKAEFSNCLFDGLFYGSTFKNASFNLVIFHGSYRECDFSNSFMSHLEGSSSPFTDSKFDDAKIDNCDFDGTDFSGSTFKNTTVRNSDFESASFLGADLESVTFFNSNFTWAEYNSKPYQQFSPTKIPSNSGILLNMKNLSNDTEESNNKNRFITELHFIKLRRDRFSSSEPVTTLKDAFLILGIDLLNMLDKDEEDELNNQVVLIEESLSGLGYGRELSLSAILSEFIGIVDIPIMQTIILGFDALDDYEGYDEKSMALDLIYKLMNINTSEDHYEELLIIRDKFISGKIAGSEFKKKFCEYWIDSSLRLAAQNFAESIRVIKEKYSDALAFARTEYRRIAKSFHPDVSRDADTSRFSLASEAMQLLNKLGFYLEANNEVDPLSVIESSEQKALPQ